MSVCPKSFKTCLCGTLTTHCVPSCSFYHRVYQFHITFWVFCAIEWVLLQLNLLTLANNEIIILTLDCTVQYDLDHWKQTKMNRRFNSNCRLSPLIVSRYLFNREMLLITERITSNFVIEFGVCISAKMMWRHKLLLVFACFYSCICMLMYSGQSTLIQSSPVRHASLSYSGFGL